MQVKEKNDILLSMAGIAAAPEPGLPLRTGAGTAYSPYMQLKKKYLLMPICNEKQKKLRKMKKIGMVIILFIAVKTNAQDTTGKALNPLTVSVYVETYYSYDCNKPIDNNKPGFIYSHNRHNEFNANLAFIKAAYNTEKTRANIAVAAGTYMNANYVAEPRVLKNIFEANAGVKLAAKKNVWLDAGIFSSHIGFESAVSKDCYNLTRSILAENSPYFEAGVKIGYTSDNGKWFLSVLALNGWQRIKRVDGNSLMSFGTQIQYKPTPATTINYSTFIGTDTPDSTRLMRYFNNLYAIFNVAKNISIVTGFDMGMQQKEKKSNVLNYWYAPIVIIKYAINNKYAFAARGEYYADEKGVIINTGTANGFKTFGYSLNADYAASANTLIRIEARTLSSKDAIFTKENMLTKNNSIITTSIAISF